MLSIEKTDDSSDDLWVIIFSNKMVLNMIRIIPSLPKNGKKLFMI